MVSGSHASTSLAAAKNAGGEGVLAAATVRVAAVVVDAAAAEAAGGELRGCPGSDSDDDQAAYASGRTRGAAPRSTVRSSRLPRFWWGANSIGVRAPRVICVMVVVVVVVVGGQPPLTNSGEQLPPP